MYRPCTERQPQSWLPRSWPRPCCLRCCRQSGRPPPPGPEALAAVLRMKLRREIFFMIYVSFSSSSWLSWIAGDPSARGTPNAFIVKYIFISKKVEIELLKFVYKNFLWMKRLLLFRFSCAKKCPRHGCACRGREYFYRQVLFETFTNLAKIALLRSGGLPLDQTPATQFLPAT